MFVNYSITFLNLYNDIIFNSEEIALKGLLMEDLKWSMPFDSRNDFYFKPSSRDFIVDEVPLYEFSGSGEHLIIRVRKKNLTTWEMIEIFSNYLGVKKREIGYAGLKDKNALTTQYISIPKKYEKGIKSLSNKNIKILFTTYHNNKIRVGHLKGNDFKLRFKKVLNINKEKLNSALEWIRKNGIPNYFGTQRFGIDGNNYKDGKKILCGKMKIRDKKSKEFLISAYQSYLFNKWLSKRVELSKLLNSFESQEVEKILQLETGSLKNIEKQKNFFKLLKGDLMMHYPFGKIFYIDNLENESNRFFNKDISPTGAIYGKKVKKAKDTARLFEDKFKDSLIKENGSRRYAWIFPDDLKSNYISEKAQFELQFTLPKGSYASILVDFLKSC